jgi:hypothetical protein
MICFILFFLSCFWRKITKAIIVEKLHTFLGDKIHLLSERITEPGEQERKNMKPAFKRNTSPKKQ